MYKSDLLWNERAPLAQFVDAINRKAKEQDSSDMVELNDIDIEFNDMLTSASDGSNPVPNDIITSYADGSNPDMLKLVHNTLRRRNALTSILQYIKPEGNGKKKSKTKKSKRKPKKSKRKPKKSNKRKTRSL